MAVQGTPKNYDKKFLFAVEIDGLEVAWFESVSGLEFEVGVVEQHEGGNINVADQSPGKVKFAAVVLSIGSTDNRELYDWALLVVDAAANSGEIDNEYKKNVSIVQKDRDQSEKRRYNLFEAWPNKYKSGEWDAKAEENVVEEVTLTYRYYEREDAA
jgi:phage tail-like protein